MGDFEEKGGGETLLSSSANNAGLFKYVRMSQNHLGFHLSNSAAPMDFHKSLNNAF